MNDKHRLFILCVAAAALHSQLCSGVQAQTYVTQSVSTTGPGAAVELFEFNTPANVAVTDRVIVAKLVVDDTSTDLEFRLEPTTVATYPVTDFKISQGNVPVNDANTGNPVATLRVRDLTTASPPETAATGYRVIKISVKYDSSYSFGPSEIWRIEAKRPATGTLNYLGFWNDGTGEATVEATVTRPKAGLDPTVLDFGEVQTNLPDQQVPVKSYIIKNIGTATLNLTGSINPPTPFALFGAVIIHPFKPMETTPPVQIKFRPTDLGTSTNTATLGITSDDPSSPISLALQGTGVTLDGIMLLDLSGSMSWFPDSSALAPEEEARLWHAKQAGQALFEEYSDLTGGQARFGLYGFPDPNVLGSVPSSIRAVEIGRSDLIAGNMLEKLGHMPAGLSTGDMTPMAEGIKLAQGDLNQATATHRSLILLLTDGYANVDSNDPPKTPDDWVPRLVSKGIRVYPVAYGDTSIPGIEVDYDLLRRLASETGAGDLLAANPTDFDALKKNFRHALRDWLGLSDTADPSSTISAGQQKAHSVCIDDQTYAIAFIVDWNPSQEDAVSVSIDTPAIRCSDARPIVHATHRCQKAATCSTAW